MSLTHIDDRVPHTTTTNHVRRARPARTSVRQARIRRSIDGVVASYIRDISAGAGSGALAGSAESRP